MRIITLILAFFCTIQLFAGDRKYKYNGGSVKEKLTLHESTNGIGFFEYVKKDKKTKKTIYYQGVYTEQSDSMIIMRDLLNGPQYTVKEEFDANVPKDSILVWNLPGAAYKYDFYDVTNPNDTIAYRNVPFKYWVHKGVKKFCIKLHRYAPDFSEEIIGELLYSDYEIKDPECNLIVFVCNKTPAIYDDVWKISKTGVIPLNNDHRTYSNHYLKRTK